MEYMQNYFCTCSLKDTLGLQATNKISRNTVKLVQLCTNSWQNHILVSEQNIAILRVQQNCHKQDL